MPFKASLDFRLRRAAALAQILAFFVLLMALAFTTASLAISNIGLVSRSQDGAVARNLALSATHLAIARLRQDSSFGAAAPFPQPLKASYRDARSRRPAVTSPLTRPIPNTWRHLSIIC